MARIAVAILRGARRASVEPQDRTGATLPREHLFDEMFSPVYDESSLDASPAARRLTSRRVPPWVQLALEVHRRRDEYDAIVTWGDRLTLSLMAIQSITRQGKPHVPMLYWLSKPNVRLPMRAFGKSLKGIVTWSSVQRQYAIHELGFAPEQVHLVKHYVDQVFWSPRERPVELISSVGSEMRDYDTLVEALRGTDLRCHIAAANVRVNRGILRHRQVNAQRFIDRAGPNVSVGAMSRLELRELYAKSQFVVIPLLESDTDNGVTVILEAMAMGKTVICSRTEGQVDVIQDGVTGLYVRQGDPAALRAAMQGLWNDPVRARAMGLQARKYVEAHHSLEKFCLDVRAAVDEQ